MLKHFNWATERALPNAISIKQLRWKLTGTRCYKNGISIFRSSTIETMEVKYEMKLILVKWMFISMA